VRVQATLAPARIDSFEGLPGEFPAEMREIGMRAGVAAPILVDGRLWGAVRNVRVHSRPRDG
jgi:hypothetical protein